MSESRKRLPNRRPGFVVEFSHIYPGDQSRTFTATIGCYDEACTKPAEVFINLVGGTVKKVNVDVHDAAVALSFALQHGADLGEMANAMLRGNDGRAHGFLGSLSDAVLLAIKEAK